MGGGAFPCRPLDGFMILMILIQSGQWGLQYYRFQLDLAILSTNYRLVTVLSTNY